MIYSEAALQVGRAIHQVRIHHPQFSAALNGIGRAIQLGTGFRQPSGISIIAPAGLGKSLLIESVQRNVCEWSFLRPNAVIVAALRETPTVSQIQDDLLANFNYAIPISKGRKTSAITFRVLVEAIGQHDVRLVALDEYQHVFMARRDNCRSAINDWVKRLMSTTACPILLSGTEMLRNIEKSDPQLTTRISSIIHLKEFENDENWRGVLAGYVTATTEVDLSEIVTKHPARILRATQGVMRSLKSLLAESAMIAIDAGDERVSQRHLCEAFGRIVGTGSTRANPFDS